MAMQGGISGNTLLSELAKEELEVVEADNRLRLAQIAFELAVRRYAAVRDYVTQRLGSSPYSIKTKWPEPYNVHTDFRGRYRFAQMEPGDAAVAALKETDTPMTLEEIVNHLRTGGLRVPSSLLTRSVNAALMRTTGIQKSEDGKYTYKEVSPDEFPF
jgi:hypothetical protein